MLPFFHLQGNQCQVGSDSITDNLKSKFVKKRMNRQLPQLRRYIMETGMGKTSP